MKRLGETGGYLNVEVYQKGETTEVLVAAVIVDALMKKDNFL